MDITPIENVLHTAIETRRAFPEGVEVLKQLLETYVSDPLKDRRERRRIDRVAKLADEKIGNREKEENLEEIMTSTEVEPLLEAIQEDDRKELQEIWANMLAKFATGQSQGFRREFISTIKRLEPIDIKVLEELLSYNSDKFIRKEIIISYLEDKTSINPDEISISIDNLYENKCISMKTNKQSGTNNYALSPYGRILSQVALASI